ncbi:NB-ARC domains-containing protein, partial [Tanacetum coccineum]
IDVVSIPGKELNDDISKVAFPSSYLLHTFHHLRNLFLSDCKAVEVVFEIMSPSSRDLAHDTQQPLILPYLEELGLYGLERISHVWKCNWNEFLILQKPQSQSSFHNLTTITMSECNSIKYEEVVSNRDDEDSSVCSHTDTTFFPHLDILELKKLRNLKCIGGIDTGKSLPRQECIMMLKLPKLKILKIQGCHLLKHVFTCSTLESLAELEELEIKDCKAMEVIVNN